MADKKVESTLGRGGAYIFDISSTMFFDQFRKLELHQRDHRAWQTYLNTVCHMRKEIRAAVLFAGLALEIGLVHICSVVLACFFEGIFV